MASSDIHNFIGGQLSDWPLARDNFKALESVRVKEMEVNGLTVRLQFNPARMISSAAKLSKEDIARRRCFLCEENRPPQQKWLDFQAGSGALYHILLNPYPIFPEHLVIAMSSHCDQGICGRYGDMLDLTRKHEGMTFFYNGPCCGASAPDHHHFQGVPHGLMPLENDVENSLFSGGPGPLSELYAYGDAVLYHYDRFAPGIFVISSKSVESSKAVFQRLMDCAEIPEGDVEPRINLYANHASDGYLTIVFFRKCHRSHHYFSEGEDHLTMSPGCADMAGVFIVPVEEEFRKITPDLLGGMISEITIPAEQQQSIVARLTRRQPRLSVGIMAAEEIEFELLGDGRGLRKAVLKDGKIEYDGKLHDRLYFKAGPSAAIFAPASFALHGVTIGVKFHWERQETQRFAGDLMIIADSGMLRAINIIGVEDYLLSVISSEMSATASEEFLKAHAVISRSWVMARMHRTLRPEAPKEVDNLPKLLTWLYGNMDVAVHTGDEFVKWYDHDEHKMFDVCADDHCQRYQGLTRVAGDTVRRVIDHTWGQVLMHEGRLCDARFSKCCGGMMEKFSTCWQDRDYPYLRPLPDTPGHDPDGECFCNTDDKAILSQVLNNYDQETVDFYQWTEELDPERLAGLIEKKFGVMTGPVKALEPLERGESGRICLLRIVGELKTITIGKELEIRRILSETHLKSSAFEVAYITDEGKPVDKGEEWSRIRLKGRGWGHGVGLCQIGAAVMATRGYTYDEILHHYYHNAGIVKIQMIYAEP